MKFQSSKRLKDLFSNVDAFREVDENSGVDELACGLVQTPSQRSDNNIVEDVSRFVIMIAHILLTCNFFTGH